VARHATLNRLDLSYNHASVLGANALARMLRTNTVLQSLLLSNNSIGDAGLAPIVAILEGPPEDEVATGDDDSEEDDALQRAIALRSGVVLKAKAPKQPMSNTTLLQLALAGNRLSARGVDSVGKMLRTNRSLTDIDVRWNYARLEKRNALLSACAGRHSQLAALDLVANELHPQGCVALSASLRLNSVLMSLKLDRLQPRFAGWSLGSTGMRALSGLLLRSASLTELSLNHANIGSAGGITLAHALRHNAALQSISLRGSFGSDFDPEADTMPYDDDDPWTHTVDAQGKPLDQPMPVHLSAKEQMHALAAAAREKRPGTADSAASGGRPSSAAVAAQALWQPTVASAWGANICERRLALGAAQLIEFGSRATAGAIVTRIETRHQVSVQRACGAHCARLTARSALLAANVRRLSFPSTLTPALPSPPPSPRPFLLFEQHSGAPTASYRRRDERRSQME
jgi:hypothetical protein